MKERKEDKTVWREATEEQQNKSLNHIWRDSDQQTIFPVRTSKMFRNYACWVIFPCFI